MNYKLYDVFLKVNGHSFIYSRTKSKISGGARKKNLLLSINKEKRYQLPGSLCHNQIIMTC